MKHARLLLIPFSFLYWLAIVVRNWFFDIGILRTTKVGVPVISVGNLSFGGVGKTPVVELLVDRLKSNGLLSVVSRGYGRKSSGTRVVSDGHGRIASVEDAGDEPSQLARKFPDLIVIVDEQRVRGARKAIELGAKVILLDDGFQHRFIKRDLNIVLMTAEEMIKGDSLIPAGNWREPLSSIRRADLIFITRCSDIEKLEQVKNAIYSSVNRRAIGARWFSSTPILGVQTNLKSFKQASSDQLIEPRSVAGKKVIAFSGIGNPKSFEVVLAQTGLIISKHLIFADHHWYNEDDVVGIMDARKKIDADFIVTTEKDAVRLRERFGSILKTEPVYIAEIQLEILAEEERFEELLKQVVH